MSDYRVDPQGLVMLDFEEVQRFITRLKDPEFLLNGCRIFLQIEPRDSVYVYALNSMNSRELSASRKAEVIQTLLLSWNALYYQYKPTLTNEIIPDLLEFLGTSEKEMNGLRHTKLGRVTDDELQIVSQVFGKLSKFESVGTTGAAKALNLLFPEVFVMWDTHIREAYHDFFHLHNNEIHVNGDSTCYASFMRTNNEIASILLPYEEKLKRQHPVFERGIDRSIAKMIDEANYARFTKTQTW